MTTAFQNFSPLFAEDTSATATTPKQIKPTGSSSTVTQYIISNASSSWMIAVLAPTSTSASVPSSGGSVANAFAVPPNSQVVQSAAEAAWFSAVLTSGTGVAYVANGAGL